MPSHYGVKTRKREREVLKQQRTPYACPSCGKARVRRQGHALWRCQACETQIAGGAYSLETPVGVTAKKTLASILQGRV